MESRSKMCRHGKECRRYLAGTCDFNHICKFGPKCRKLKEHEGCKFVHLEKAMKKGGFGQKKKNQNLLQKWLTGDLDGINMPSLQTILKSELQCNELEDFLKLMQKILNSDKPAMITSLTTVVKNTQILTLENLKKLRQGFPVTGVNAKNLGPVLLNLSTWIQGANRLVMTHPSEHGQVPSQALIQILASFKQDAERIKKYSLDQQERQVCAKYEKLCLEALNLLDRCVALGRPQPKSEEKKIERKVEQEQKFQPPQDFRLLPIVPTIDELLSRKKPYLSKIRVDGAFDSLEHYLDCNFRLLKEDFSRQFREGLQDYIRDPNQRNLNSNVFAKAQVFFFFIEKGIEGLFLHIYPRNRGFQWSSKKLKFGSLIIFSHDKFRTIYSAVVRESKFEKMKYTMMHYGYVEISVELLDKTQSPVNVYQRLSGQNIVILESKAYFEAYYYNLQILQQIDELPFTDLIVRLDFRHLRRPQFLTQEYQQQAIQKTRLNKDFDRAQRMAVLSCFDRSLTIIQGPPGTGKTFIGAFIFKILLEIQKQQLVKDRGMMRSKPIFLVCYTNHALDQFLEKIEGFTKEIVRLGGRSKVESFKNYSLIQTCKDKKFTRGRDYWDLKKQSDGYLKRHWQLSSQVFHYTHLKIMHPSQRSTHLFLNEIFEVYKEKLKAKIQEIKNFRGYSVATKFIQAEQEMRDALKCPEIFHWLGLLDFAFLEQDHAQEEQKEIDEFDIMELEEEIDEYIEDIHSRDTAEIKEQIEYIIGMRPPLLRPRHSTMQMEISGLYNHYKARLTEEIVNDLMERGLADVRGLSIEKRWYLNILMVDNAEFKLKQELNSVVQKLKEIKVKQDQIDRDQSIRALQSVDVVAMTTTGAAKYKALLKNVTSQIMIVEEAAEVLEAHITTALTKHTQQLILIGDHQQLRPSITVFELAKKYNLDVSMFERLIMGVNRPKYPCITLSHQRRMRPEISEIVRIIYPELKDSETVLGRRNVRGMGGKNIFFWNHDYREETDPNIQSKLNIKEAEFILLFSRYLLQQGYEG